ncbi:MAG: hypothetical protein AAB834_06280 [Patescibacteria group bacterium]
MESARPRRQEHFDLDDCWCITMGYPAQVPPEVARLGQARIAEIDRRFPSRTHRTDRTIEISLYVFELTGLIMPRHYHIQSFETIRQAYFGIISQAVEAESTPEAIAAVEQDVEELEVHSYLRELVADRVGQAAELHDQLDADGRDNIRRSTGHFIGRKSYGGRRSPEIFAVVPVLQQLRSLEDKGLIDVEERKYLEGILRIIIAQQHGIDIPEPSTPHSVE